jgi:hypothetical protein
LLYIFAGGKEGFFLFLPLVENVKAGSGFEITFDFPGMVPTCRKKSTIAHSAGSLEPRTSHVG